MKGKGSGGMHNSGIMVKKTIDKKQATIIDFCLPAIYHPVS